MTTRVTISIDEGILATVRDAARSRGSSVSAVIAEATEREMTRLAGLQAVRDWEAEHGEFTPAERDAATKKIGEALARLARQLGGTDTADAA